MITVTLKGDHDRPEWLITINGIRMLARIAGYPSHRLDELLPWR